MESGYMQEISVDAFPFTPFARVDKLEKDSVGEQPKLNSSTLKETGRR